MTKEEIEAREKELDAKLEAARKRRAEREVGQDAIERVRERENQLALEELRERFDEEQGEHGVDYAICDLTKLGKGYVVVKRGPSALIRKYKARFRGEHVPTEAETHDLVKANLLHPDVDVFKAIATDHDFVATKIANVICDLHGVGLEMKVGKL